MTSQQILRGCCFWETGNPYHKYDSQFRIKHYLEGRFYQNNNKTWKYEQQRVMNELHSSFSKQDWLFQAAAENNANMMATKYYILIIYCF